MWVGGGGGGGGGGGMNDYRNKVGPCQILFPNIIIRICPNAHYRHCHPKWIFWMSCQSLRSSKYVFLNSIICKAELQYKV